MKKIIVLTLLLMFLAVPVFAADWSDFESGRPGGIRLDGYQSLPGYIAFTDGSGTTTGYLWMGTTDGGTVPVLLYCSADAIDLTTTKLSDAVGVIVGTGY